MDPWLAQLESVTFMAITRRFQTAMPKSLSDSSQFLHDCLFGIQAEETIVNRQECHAAAPGHGPPL